MINMVEKISQNKKVDHEVLLSPEGHPEKLLFEGNNFFDILEKAGILLSQDENEIHDNDGMQKIMEAVAAIDKLPFDYFFYELLPILGDDKKRHSLPDPIIEAIMNRGFFLIDNLQENKGSKNDIKKDELSELLIMELERAIQLHGDFTKKNSSDESITDKVFKAFIKNYRPDSKAMREFFKSLSQDPQTIRPDIFIEGLVEINYRPDFDDNLKADALHSLNYAYSFFGRIYDQALVNNLNFDNRGNFSRTAAFLEFINKLSMISQDYSFSEEAGRNLEKVLKEAVDKNKGSYFLNLRAREVCEEMEKGNRFGPGRDRLPFVLSEGIYGWQISGKMHLANKKDFPEITKIMEEIETTEDKIRPPQYLIDEAIRNGEDWVHFQADPRLMRQLETAYDKLSLLFHEEISESEIFVGQTETNNDQKQKYSLLVDYNFLMQKTNRKRIAQELNLDLSKLAIREQFFFLQFIKEKPAAEIQPIKDFGKKYGADGLKAFLACEYDMKIGDMIIELGEKLSQEQAEKIFGKYKEIVDEADKVLEMAHSFNKEIDVATKNKIKDNLLRKAKDLILNFHHKLIGGEKIEVASQELDSIKSDIILFASTFKALSGAGERIDFKEVSRVRIETKKPADLSPQEKEEMVRIFMANREQGYPEKLLKEVFDDFEQSINPEEDSAKAAADFTILKYNGQIVSFLRLEPRGENRVYAAAFNTRPEVKGFKIGNAMMKEIIERAADHKDIEAVAYSQKPDLLQFYQEFFGFEPVGETEIAGEKFIRIEKPARSLEKGGLAEAA